jgi:hypothetical protein
LEITKDGQRKCKCGKLFANKKVWQIHKRHENPSKCRLQTLTLHSATKHQIHQKEVVSTLENGDWNEGMQDTSDNLSLVQHSDDLALIMSQR